MNAVLKTETIALETAAPLEVADPTKNLILVPLSQLLPRRSKRNVRTTPRQSIPEAETPDVAADEMETHALAA